MKYVLAVLSFFALVGVANAAGKPFPIPPSQVYVCDVRDSGGDKMVAYYEGGYLVTEIPRKDYYARWNFVEARRTSAGVNIVNYVSVKSNRADFNFFADLPGGMFMVFDYNYDLINKVSVHNCKYVAR